MSLHQPQNPDGLAQRRTIGALLERERTEASASAIDAAKNIMVKARGLKNAEKRWSERREW
jgi:hypothetical protein